VSLDDVLTMPSTCVCPNVLDGSNDLPLSARYALITELGKTLKREILPLPQEFEVGTSCPKECRVLGFDQAKCHCYGIMPSNARYAL
jgi:hypothetical protein